MVLVVVSVLGLIFGSFINAFVWRLHENKDWISGHSECIECHHRLKMIDLVPILSWLLLKGQCRYCHKKISVQYPLVELLTAILFFLSYAYWPVRVTGVNAVEFGFWLVMLIGLIALAVYDLKWMLLPTNVIYALIPIGLVMALISISQSNDVLKSCLDYILAILVGGGLFYLVFIISKGKWIGGGDVRLGFLLGLLAGTPGYSFLFIFLASIIGSIVSILLLSRGKMKKNSLIPFGPFLIAGLFIVQLAGSSIVHWYTTIFI